MISNAVGGILLASVTLYAVLGGPDFGGGLWDLLADPTRRMAKAYGMWAGEEPYNCSKRGTVIVDRNGKIAHYAEVPMREPRKTEELVRLIAQV